MAKHWKIEAVRRGPHVEVTVRCGPKPQDRALLGKLVMDAEEWQQFKHAAHQGLPGQLVDEGVVQT